MVSEGHHRPHVRLVDLELRRVSKRFGDLEVIHDLSLAVHKGELCCLLGPSGCGKTTTLKIIAGLLQAESGSVHLAEQDITCMPPQKRNVGMVFQSYALFPHMNVLENVAYGLHRRKWPDAKIKPKVAEILRLVRLDGYQERRIHELSGGQQQRIALARALIIEPKLLLLDEPLSNLDARLRADMRDEIRRIQQALSITTIHVTHDQEEAMSIADRIAVMTNGRIEQIGSPVEIYERPATQFVTDFIGRVNFIDGRTVRGELELLGRRYPISQSEWPERTEVTCAIRPERVRMHGPSPSSLKARVQDSTYFGAMVHYRVTLEAKDGTGTDLNVELPSPLATFKPGDEVGIELRVEDMHLFRHNPRRNGGQLQQPCGKTGRGHDVQMRDCC